VLFSGALQYGQPHCSVTRIGPITRPDRESAVKSFPEVAADKPQKKIAHLEGGRPPQLAASFIYCPSARDGCIWKSKIHSGHRVVTTVVSRPVRARSSLVRSIIWKNCFECFWLIGGIEILTIANRLSIGAGGECGVAEPADSVPTSRWSRLGSCETDLPAPSVTWRKLLVLQRHPSCR